MNTIAYKLYEVILILKKFILILISVFMIGFEAYAVSPEDISAECACLIEQKTGKVLFSKNKDLKHAMASTTKIMTAIIALEESDPDDIVTMSATAASTEGSSVYIEAGEKIKMLDLIYGLMLNSGNDAAVAISEHISGSVPEFCEKMNEKTKELGLKNTSFKNPNGLFEEGHFTTASDLAEITRYAMKNEHFREIVKTKNKKVNLVDTGKELYFGNHNKLLWNYEGSTGVKTGYTKDTGRCLVSSAERNGSSLILVTLDAPNDWNDHKVLLDYGFSKIETRIIIEKDQVLKTAEINGVLCDFVAASDSILTIEQGENVNTLVNIKIPDKLTGPYNLGEKVGVAEVILNGEIVDKVDIISTQEVFEKQEKEIIVEEKKGFFERLFNIILKFFLYS